jgi:hypothetical protein
MLSKRTTTTWAHQPSQHVVQLLGRGVEQPTIEEIAETLQVEMEVFAIRVQLRETTGVR